MIAVTLMYNHVAHSYKYRAAVSGETITTIRLLPPSISPITLYRTSIPTLIVRPPTLTVHLLVAP